MESAGRFLTSRLHPLLARLLRSNKLNRLSPDVETIVQNEAARGLVTFYMLCVIDLATRRVQILGCTRHPNALFMEQIARALIFGDEGPLALHRVLICDRDAKWSRAVRDQLTEAGLHVVQTPYRAPNANAHAERFVRSVKGECLNR